MSIVRISGAAPALVRAMLQVQQHLRPSWAVALLMVFGAMPAAAEVGPVAELPHIVNGVDSHDFPTTGALMYAGNTPINENNADSWCSGTLIGCQTFLTASHCVEGDQNPSHYWVYLQHSGIHAVTSIVQHPSYTDAGFPEYDVTVLKLDAPVTGITPTPINETASPAFGSGGTIAGFGQTSGSGNDYGIKRAGNVQTASCSGLPGGLGNTELVCWEFAAPVGPAGDDSNTCNGDSGGPLFVDLGAGPVVACVTSGGTSGNCLATDDSYDANVYTYRSFISGQLGVDSTNACGAIPPVGNADVDVVGNAGTLSGGHTSDTYSVNVPANTNEVRFTLNGENDGTFRVDLYVKYGATVSTTDYDCKADGLANLGACVFSLPASGQWSVLVRRTAGTGQYQQTTTIFGGAPPVCGNDVREAGEQCDGSDDSLCPGLCDGSCTCPAPVCGNAVVEQGEQCDGSPAAACPTGVCDPDCTCQDPVCGNDIVEAGETCDGSDDSACPGQCAGDCTCPLACTSGDLFVLKARINERTVAFRHLLDNSSGTYDSLDPRDGFSYALTQGPDSVTIDVQPLDAGWAKSRPDKGR